MLFSLDIETEGLSYFKDRLLCIGIYSPEFGYLAFKTASDFQQWNRKENLYVAHNGSFDVNWLRHLGVDIRDQFAYDTKALATILIPTPKQAPGQKTTYGLENLHISLLNGTAYKLDRSNMAGYSYAEVIAYNEEDCKITYKLFDYMLSHIPQSDWPFVENWLMPAVKLCADMEYGGIFIDKSGLELYKKSQELQFSLIKKELEELTKEGRELWYLKEVEELKVIYDEMALKASKKTESPQKKETTKIRYANLFSKAKEKIEPFNFASPKQLSWLLKEYYELDLYNKREEKDTTNEAKLKEINHPVTNKLCEYREFDKLLNTCIPALLENIKEDGNVHAHFNIGGTRTGRLSSSGPNLQQIPRGPIRSYIKSRSGTSLITADYSQIEVRIIAEITQEEELIYAFKQGIDPYSVIASKLFGIDCDVREIKSRFPKERNCAKTAGLSILYGTGAYKLKEVIEKDLGLKLSVQECKSYIERYREGLPKVSAFKQGLERDLANRKVYYNLLGRPFYIEENEDIYLKGLNTLVQGSASDLVVYSQTNFVIPALKKLGIDFTHRMLIHDEVVIEVPAMLAEELTKTVIEPAMTTEIEKTLSLAVPLKIEYTIAEEWSKP